MVKYITKLSAICFILGQVSQLRTKKGTTKVFYTVGS